MTEITQIDHLELRQMSRDAWTIMTESSQMMQMANEESDMARGYSMRTDAIAMQARAIEILVEADRLLKIQLLEESAQLKKQREELRKL